MSDELEEFKRQAASWRQEAEYLQDIVNAQKLRLKAITSERNALEDQLAALNRRLSELAK